MTDVVAALVWANDRFLACQRPAHKARGLLWEFVGGKVEPGETLEEALIRECREELDVTVAPGSVFMSLVHEYPDLTVRLTLFNARIVCGIPKQLEHNDIRWITTDQIDGMDFCPADEEILRKLKTIRTGLQAELCAMADAAYKRFQSSLMPTVDPDAVLGVRMPALRKLAANMRGDGTAEAFLNALPHRFYEENCLHAILVSQLEDPIPALERFLPHVDNWAVCDIISPKAFACHPPALMEHVRAWLDSSHCYTRRYAIGILMKYYLDDAFDPAYIRLAAGARSNEYYVNMMLAWYFATALAKQYEETLPVLENRLLDEWVHRKTIQKAIESYRIPPERKAYLRTLK